MKAKYFALALAMLMATPAMAQMSGTAFLKYSYVSGMNRICVYDLLGSKYVMTIGAVELCPLSVRVG